MGNVLFSNKHALYFLKLSRFARFEYSRLKKLPKFQSNKNNLYWIESKETDTQGFFFYDKYKKHIEISFRGSQQLRDWLNDFNAFHMVYPYENYNTKIRVHQGIYGCYRSIRSQMLHLISETINKNIIEKIYFTGHSLGSAVTTFAAVDIQYNFPFLNNKIIGYISGGPAVFNKAGKESFNKRLPNFYRTYMRTDWVPYLPPTWFGAKLHGGYHQIGIPNPIGPKRRFYGLWVWLKTLRNPASLAENATNHSILLYEKWIKK